MISCGSRVEERADVDIGGSWARRAAQRGGKWVGDWKKSSWSCSNADCSVRITRSQRSLESASFKEVFLRISTASLVVRPA